MNLHSKKKYYNYIILVFSISICIVTTIFIITFHIKKENDNTTADVPSINPTSNGSFYLSYINTLSIPDQSTLNDCGAVQIVEILNYYYSSHFSVLALYYYGRELDGGNGNIGVHITNYFSAINNYGLVSESDWPYNISNYNVSPPKSVIVYKPNITVSSFNNKSVISIQNYINNNKVPVLIEINLYSSFKTVNNTGIISIPNTTSESFIAKHAVSLWGWDNNLKVFIMLNSWGPGSGNNGWYFLPFNYIETPSLLGVDGIYNITKII